jgi:hypothetical protein
MPSTLETLSWIAAIAALPLIIGGWFFSARRNTNKSVASRGATANAGDVSSGRATIVTGHNSPVNVSLRVGEHESQAYERRYEVFCATRTLIDEAHSRKLLSDATFHSFVTGARDGSFLFDDTLATYLNEIRDHAASLQSITITMEALPSGDDKARAANAAGEHRRWLIAQSDVLAEKFRPFLQFNVRLPQPSFLPDWSIRDLFFHIRPDLIHDPKNHLWESVGRDVIDKFSTTQLTVWGRRIEDSRRLALAEIPAKEWQRAKFTYWFLKEHDGLSLDVDCYQSSRGSAPLQYADLRVSRAQVLTIWPKSPV